MRWICKLDCLLFIIIVIEREIIIFDFKFDQPCEICFIYWYVNWVSFPSFVLIWMIKKNRPSVRSLNIISIDSLFLKFVFKQLVCYCNYLLFLNKLFHVGVFLIFFILQELQIINYLFLIINLLFVCKFLFKSGQFFFYEIITLQFVLFTFIIVNYVK